MLCKRSVHLFLFVYILLSALSAQAVMRPGIAAEDYSLNPKPLLPRSLAERYDDLLEMATGTQFYIPDAALMSDSDLCYHIIAAAKTPSLQRELYNVCFYGKSDERVLNSYKALVRQQLVDFIGGPQFLRHYFELNQLIGSFYEVLFEAALLEKAGSNLDLKEIYLMWRLKYIELTFKLPNEKLEKLFGETFLNYSQQVQLSRAKRFTEKQLFDQLKTEIRASWSEAPTIQDFRKAKLAGDNLGFRVLKQQQERQDCVSLLADDAKESIH